MTPSPISCLRQRLFIMLAILSMCAASAMSQASANGAVESPRIESIVPLAKQPHESDPAIIWYDDFNGPEKAYGEQAGALDAAESFGGAGKSVPSVYKKGSQGVGNRNVFFGDYPGRAAVRKGEKFEEIYWRIYVKHQPGWTGGGEAKLSRATSLTSDKWTQAMIAHVWSGPGDSLTLDPASGIRDGRVVTTHYNDFDNLHWLGNRPASAFNFSSPAESGWWVCVESYARLNTPGLKDGVNKLWIDGHLDAQRDHLDFRGTYTAHGINAVFLESYWNQGSPVDQTRWLDNFVISTKPIGPVVCPTNPVLIKASRTSVNQSSIWEVELATADEGNQIVWKSHGIKGQSQVKVDAANGDFVGKMSGKDRLSDGLTYYCRVREMTPGEAWLAWSPWHQGFVAEQR